MKHCYIFDYSSASIYHTEIPDDIEQEDVESYLIHRCTYNPNIMELMISDNPIQIEEL